MVTTETLTRSAACNRASAVLDARGARSFFCRIFSSAAITKSRAGCVMYGDHPKFPGGLQTISVKHTRANVLCHVRSGLSPKFSGQRLLLRPVSAAKKILKTRGDFANRPLDPAIPVQCRVPF